MLWIGAIIAIGVLIVVHEAGHFFVARWCKMRVDRFSVGFGPAVWSKKRGDTTFQIAPIPFGGYVQINGMLIADEIDEDDPHAYPNRPAWQRFVTIFAGPATNYLFAIFLAFILYVIAGVPTGTSWYEVRGTTAGFDASGKLVEGDRILRIKQFQHEPIYFRPYGPVPRDIEAIAADSQGKPLLFTIRRNGKEQEVEVAPTPATGEDGKKTYALGATLGRDPSVPGLETHFRVKGVEAAGGAAGGLRAGDEILSLRRVVVDEPLYYRYEGETQKQLSDYVQEAHGQPLHLVVLRDGKEVGPIAVLPKVHPTKKTDKGEPVYRMGVVLNFHRERSDEGVFTSFGHALWYPVKQTELIVSGLYDVVRGKQKGSLTGPVGITNIIKESIAAGWIPVLELLMILNVYLGLFNLFPLPALDGGRLVFLTYEMATRRRANPKIEATVHMVGIMALLVIMVLVTYKDIARLL